MMNQKKVLRRFLRFNFKIMKTILGLNSEEAKKYFFKNSSYINFDIPIYFDFSELFLKLIAEI